MTTGLYIFNQNLQLTNLSEKQIQHRLSYLAGKNGWTKYNTATQAYKWLQIAFNI